MSGKRVNVGIEGETPREIIGRKTMNNAPKKKVNVGIEGETPKKIYAMNNRRVNVGEDGRTPKKVVHSDGSMRSFNIGKKVNVGEEGNTPTKRFEYNSVSPVAAAATAGANSATSTTNMSINPSAAIRKSSFAPKYSPYVRPGNGDDDDDDDSTGNNGEGAGPASFEVEFSPGGTARPKTSRGKSHPSPDEFFSYVVRSPPSKVNQDNNQVVFISGDGEGTGPWMQQERESVNDDDNDDDDDDDDDDDSFEFGQRLREGEEEVYETVEGDPDIESHFLHKTAKRTPSFERTPSHDDDEDGGNGINIRGIHHDNKSKASTGLQQDLEASYVGEAIPRDKQVRILACWLFGSALRI